MDEYVRAVALALANKIVDYLHIDRTSIPEYYADGIVEVLEGWLKDYNLHITVGLGERTQPLDLTDFLSPEDKREVEKELDDILNAPDKEPEGPFHKLINRVEDTPDPLIAKIYTDKDRTEGDEARADERSTPDFDIPE